MLGPWEPQLETIHESDFAQTASRFATSEGALTMSDVESSSCPSILSIPDDESEDENGEMDALEDQDENDDEPTQDSLFTDETNDLFRHLSEQKSEAQLSITDAQEAEVRSREKAFDWENKKRFSLSVCRFTQLNRRSTK